jgi:hypothetical protein
MAAEAPAIDQQALYRALAAARKALERGAERVTVERTRTAKFRVLVTHQECLDGESPPAA